VLEALKYETPSDARFFVNSEEQARSIRRLILETISVAGLGHIGSDLSVADILAVLYTDVLRLDPERPQWPDRDRLIVSKGHAAVALYSTMTLNGFLTHDELMTFAQRDSRLNGHPARAKLPGIETCTGPLGHGLPVSVGMTVGARIVNADWNTYVVTGDGELQEGSNWEAIMFAGHQKLTGLTCIVDRNGLQQGALTEETNSLDPLDEKFEAFGWDAAVIDGHDHDALREAILATGPKPRAVIAETTKGKGVSFMENLAVWHHKVPSADQFAQALAEVNATR